MTISTPAPFEVLSPLGVPAPGRPQVAPAPTRRDGLHIALVSNGKVNGSELLQAIAEQLQQRLPGLQVTHYRKPSVSIAPTDEDFEKIVATADAAICAIGDCGSCSSRTMRDAIDLEWAGIPSVAVVADALISPVDFMRRLSGMPDYPYAVTAFPVGNLTPAELDDRAAALAPEIERLLFTGRPTAAAAHAQQAVAPAPPTAAELLRYESESASLDDFVNRGLTDGLPVVAPTPERIEAMLSAAGVRGGDVLFDVPTRNNLTITAELVAANAVMAGCRPEEFGLVLAAVEALGRPEYNLHAHTATLSGAQQVMIVNGPVRHRLGVNSAEGALGPGSRTNAVVGRALRLVVRNGCRSVHGQFDRASFSHPGRYSWCFGEAEEESPWTPLSTEAGLPAGVDAVSLYATVWQASTICHSRDAVELLDEVALSARTACHLNWLHRDVAADSSFYATRPFLFVVGYQHAAVLTAGGYRDKASIQEALFARLTDPDPRLRAAAVADPANIKLVYVHATGFQQTWFFAPFQSHELVTAPLASADRLRQDVA